MISKRSFVNKIRELGYEFKEQLHYQERYRLRGGTHVIHIPRKNILDDDYVRLQLRQAKVSKEEIEKFLREAKA